MKKDKKQNGNKTKDGSQRKARRGLFKRTRAGVVLTRDEVKRIRRGRKKLRKDMRAAGIRGRKQFETTASSLGLYFDKSKKHVLFWMFLAKYGGWLAFGLAIALIAAMFGISIITEMKGHFTINMTRDLFTEGFVLSETAGFENPTSHLFTTPAVDVPCISMIDIPNNVDEIDGEHHGNYFAYTFYLKNSGENVSAYKWELRLNSESRGMSRAAWAMIFVDGEMSIYAKAREDGTIECLPERDSQKKGYFMTPLKNKARFPDVQYEVNAVVDGLSYYRVNPFSFESDEVMASGEEWGVEPGEYHKYTVVLWLEGDDPDCTNELIGGHLGYEMYFELIEENEQQ